MDKEKVLTISIITAVVVMVFFLMAISFFLGKESNRGDNSGQICSGSDCKSFVPMPPIQGEPRACSQEAKLCPDGSSVGRIGPNCEFAPCPGIGSDLTPGTPYTEPSGRVCTQEMKQCPNGGFVARTGPNCEFAPCE